MEEKIFTADVAVKNTLEVVRLTRYGRDGEKRQKTISYLDFVTSLANGVRKERFSLGLMPEGTVWFDADPDGVTNVVIRVPAKKRTLLYGRFDTRLHTVPYPELLMKITVLKDKVSPSLCFALPSGAGEINEDMQLYRFPFGNVSGIGHICMGGNLIPRNGMTLRAAVGTALDVFFNSPYTGDYYQSCSMISTGDSLKDALAKLEGMDSFPDSWLVRSEKRLGDIAGTAASV